MAKPCLPAGRFSQRAGTAGLTPSGKIIFSLLYNSILAEERYLWGASPAVLCKTGLCKITETKGFKSTKTFSITWAMSGMIGMLISSRIYIFSKPSSNCRAVLSFCHLSSWREWTHVKKQTTRIIPSPPSNSVFLRLTRGKMVTQTFKQLDFFVVLYFSCFSTRIFPQVCDILIDLSKSSNSNKNPTCSGRTECVILTQKLRHGAHVGAPTAKNMFKRNNHTQLCGGWRTKCAR